MKQTLIRRMRQVAARVLVAYAQRAHGKAHTAANIALLIDVENNDGDTNYRRQLLQRMGAVAIPFYGEWNPVMNLGLGQLFPRTFRALRSHEESLDRLHELVDEDVQAFIKWTTRVVCAVMNVEEPTDEVTDGVVDGVNEIVADEIENVVQGQFGRTTH